MALVGARMEAVVPKRSLFGPDYLLLAALLAVAAMLHIWIVAQTKLTARDSVGFARTALCIQSPESSNPDQAKDLKRTKIEVIRGEQQHPGYPLAVWVTAKFVRQTIVPGMPNGEFASIQLAESTLLATQIASAIAAVLLVIPMYITGRMLFGRSAAFAGTLLFQVLPVPAHVTSDGLTEGVYLLLMTTALMLAVRAVRRPGVGGFLLTGFAIGASYLVRPEALLLAAGVGLFAAWFGYARRWPRDLTAGRIAALGVGLMLVAGPYMLLIGGMSNKPTAIELANPTGESQASMWQGEAERPAVPLFAMWMPSSVKNSAFPFRVLWGAEAIGLETFKGLHYLPAAFALFALIVNRRRIAADPGLLVLLVIAAINILLLTYMGSRRHYVSERHTILLVLMGCLFAGAALEPVAAALGKLPAVGFFWAGKLGVPALLVILVGTGLPSTLRPLHSNREGFKHAGIWLGDHATMDDCVVDPFSWSNWYAGRTLYFVKPDPDNAPITYAIVDDKMRDDDHERLPRMEAARNVATDGRSELVYCWPEGSNKDTAKVKIYKLVRK